MEMNLKDATVVVLICVGVSVVWALVSLVIPPQALQGLYRSRIPSLLHVAREASLLLFFAILLKNQK
jgi:hypothetical protein